MKKIMPLFLALTAFNTAYATVGIEKMDSFTKDDLEVYGSANLTNGSVKNKLHIVGPLNFTNLEVKGDADIKGSVLKSKNGHFNNLKVTGPVNFSDTDISNDFDVTGPTEIHKVTVHGKTTILGPLTAYDSKLGNIEITTGSIELKSSEAQDIHVKNDLKPLMEQKLLLDEKSKVTGKITFDSGKGKVVDKSGTIKVEQIKGGALEKK
jgi:hypothetical protein